MQPNYTIGPWPNRIPICGHLARALHTVHNCNIYFSKTTPEHPAYTTGMTPGNRDSANLLWKALKAKNDNINNMNDAIISFFFDDIRPIYNNKIESYLVRRTNRNIG